MDTDSLCAHFWLGFFGVQLAGNKQVSRDQSVPCLSDYLQLQGASCIDMAIVRLASIAGMCSCDDRKPKKKKR